MKASTELPTKNELFAMIGLGTPDERKAASALMDAGLFRPPRDDEDDHALKRLSDRYHQMTPEEHARWLAEDKDLTWDGENDEPVPPAPVEDPSFFKAPTEVTISISEPPKPESKPSFPIKIEVVDAEPVDSEPDTLAWRVKHRQESIYTGDSQVVRRVRVYPSHTAGRPSEPPSPGYDSYRARTPLD